MALELKLFYSFKWNRCTMANVQLHALFDSSITIKVDQEGKNRGLLSHCHKLIYMISN